MFGRRKREKKPKKPAAIVRAARRLGYEPGRIMTEVLEWTEILAVAGFLAVIIMSFITVRMHVPTDSMWPTINGDPSILRADSFFVDRLTYHFREPKPGDIVVFWHPEEVWVDRVIEGSAADLAGLTRDLRIEYVNTTPVYTKAFAEGEMAAWLAGTPLQLTVAGKVSFDLGEMAEGASTFEDLGIVVRERRQRYVKRLIAVGGQTVQIANGKILVDGTPLEGERFDRDYISEGRGFNFGVEPTLVPEDHYFVLGDNSINSFDSRFWGFVHKRDIIGVPYLRVWPLPRFGPM